MNWELFKARQVLEEVVRDAKLTHEDDGSIEKVGDRPYIEVYEAMLAVGRQLVHNSYSGMVSKRTRDGGLVDLAVSPDLITVDVIRENRRQFMGLSRHTAEATLPMGARLTVRNMAISDSQMMDSIPAEAYVTRPQEGLYAQGIRLLAETMLDWNS